MEYQKDIFRTGRRLYLCQSTLEYLVAVLAANPFLAALTTYMGMSDGMTGIVSSIPVIGFSFQFFSVLIHIRRAKPFVMILSILNQLLFTMMYVIPLLPLPSPLQSILFALVMLLAFFLYNIAHPKKVHWYMSMVEENRRGRFTALKEMLFLTAGMICTYALGCLMDDCKARGEIETAFLICVFIQLSLTILHTITMACTTEKSHAAALPRKGMIRSLKALFRDRAVLKVIGVFSLLQLTCNSACTFYGTYQIKELGFSMQTASLLIIVSSIARILVSPLWGRYADRYSFARMCTFCFGLQALSFLVAMFAMPGPASILFFVYSILYWMAWGGINSALINLVYESVAPEKCEDTLALSQAVAGTVGFLTTVICSLLVTHIQQAGNHFLGMQVYAQQVVSCLALFLNIFLILFTHFSLGHPKKSTAK